MSADVGTRKMRVPAMASSRCRWTPRSYATPLLTPVMCETGRQASTGAFSSAWVTFRKGRYGPRTEDARRLPSRLLAESSELVPSQSRTEMHTGGEFLGPDAPTQEPAVSSVLSRSVCVRAVSPQRR